MRIAYNGSLAVILFLMMMVTGILTTQTVLAQRGDDSDRVSKNGKTEGTIDSIDVVVEYGRPQVKGREIWGGLVPYDQVWRTGANEATTISFSEDVMIEGKKLPEGKYALFTIPGKDQWTIIFNKEPQQWGAFKYDKSKDALRVMVKPETGEHVEEMTFVIDGSDVILEWGKLRVPFKVTPASE